MTYSLIGLCRPTGQLGAVVSTSDIAVGSRVPFARANLGVVVTQQTTDPRLGPLLLTELEAGRTAQEAVDTLRASGSQVIEDRARVVRGVRADPRQI